MTTATATSAKHRSVLLAQSAAVLLLLLFISLGWWQLERAREKSQRIELQSARMHEPPRELGAAQLDGAALQFAPLWSHGVFESAPQVLIDNIIRDGAPGYEVLTPFRPQRGTRRVWVNRGWLPWDTDTPRTNSGRTQQPPPPPSGLSRISGHVEPATHGRRLQLSAAGCCALPPPGPWLEPNLEALRRIAPWPVQPFIMRLDPGADAGADANTPDHGLLRDPIAPPSSYWVHRHRAYAVQWFALALLVPVIWIAVTRRRRSHKAEHKEH